VSPLTELTNEINSRIALGFQLGAKEIAADSLSPYVVRGPFGLDLVRKGLVMGASAPEGTRVVLHRRSVQTTLEGAEQTARALLARLEGRTPQAVLGFECAARTAPLLGAQVSRQEQEVVQNILGREAAWLGMLVWGELAPYGGCTTYFNYTYPIAVLTDWFRVSLPMPTPEEIIWHQTTELLQRDSRLAALRQQQTRILSWYDVSQELAQAIREDSTVEAVLESWADAMVSRMGFHVALVLHIDGTQMRRVCRRPSLEAESAEPVDERCAELLKRSPSGRVENGSTEVPVLARLGRIERFFYGQITAGRSYSYLLAVGYDARGVRLRATLHTQDMEPFYRAALQVESLAKNVLLVQSLAHQEELTRLSAELSAQKEALQQLGLIVSQGALIRRLSAPVLQV